MARLSDGQREICDEANRDARDFEEAEMREQMRFDEQDELARTLSEAARAIRESRATIRRARALRGPEGPRGGLS